MRFLLGRFDGSDDDGDFLEGFGDGGGTDDGAVDVDERFDVVCVDVVDCADVDDAVGDRRLLDLRSVRSSLGTTLRISGMIGKSNGSCVAFCFPWARADLVGMHAFLIEDSSSEDITITSFVL